MIANKPALEAKMIDAARVRASRDPLAPNKLAEYKDVAAVMASAQRSGSSSWAVGNEQFVK